MSDATTPKTLNILDSKQWQEKAKGLSKTPWLVPGMLPPVGVAAFIASPGVGKSLTLLELSRAVAIGGVFAGRQVSKAGNVLYCCPDSPASNLRRLMAFTEKERDRICVLESISIPGDMPALTLELQARAERGQKIDLLVIDTWDASRDHGDGGGYSAVDARVEMTMRAVRGLADQFELLVAVSHHCTRAADHARGTMVFDAKCEAIFVLKGEDKRLKMTSPKIRDGDPSAIDVSWRIVPVVVPELESDVTVPTLQLIQGDCAPPKVEDKLDLAVRKLLGGPKSQSQLAKEVGISKGRGSAALARKLEERGLAIKTGSVYELTPAGKTKIEKSEHEIN